jgi:hypothetical protein
MKIGATFRPASQEEEKSNEARAVSVRGDHIYWRLSSGFYFVV